MLSHALTLVCALALEVNCSEYKPQVIHPYKALDTYFIFPTNSSVWPISGL